MRHQRDPGHVEGLLEQPQARHQTPGTTAFWLDGRFAGQLQASTLIGLVADNLAIAHLDDALRIRRDLGVMGDDNHRVPRRVQLGEDAHHLFAAVGVEGAGGFVGEDHFAAVHQGAGDTHPLLLATGELAGAMGGVTGQAEPREQLPCAAVALGFRRTGVDRWHFHVVQGTQVRQQMVALEDKTEVIAAQFSQLLITQGAGFDAVDFVAAGRGVIQAAEDVHQGGFPRA